MPVKIGTNDGDISVMWMSEGAGQSLQEPVCGVSGEAGREGHNALKHVK